MADVVKTWWPVTDRKIFIKIQGSPIEINKIQVYAPTSDHDDDAVEGFYHKLEEVRGQTTAHDLTIILGDLNAKFGRGREGDLVVCCGMGERNCTSNTRGNCLHGGARRKITGTKLICHNKVTIPKCSEENQNFPLSRQRGELKPRTNGGSGET